MPPSICFLFFFFNDTATTEIYTLSLHDALPISWSVSNPRPPRPFGSNSSPPSCNESRSHRSEEHTSELQSPCNLVCRLLLEKKKFTDQDIRSQTTQDHDVLHDAHKSATVMYART